MDFIIALTINNNFQPPPNWIAKGEHKDIDLFQLFQHKNEENNLMETDQNLCFYH